MSQTAIIAIGNSDNKLTQLQWVSYIKNVNYTVMDYSDKIYFHGFAAPNVEWQNAAWIFDLADDPQDEHNLIKDLQRIAYIYNQESIALVIGDTIFVKPEATP